MYDKKKLNFYNESNLLVDKLKTFELLRLRLKTADNFEHKEQKR